VRLLETLTTAGRLVRTMVGRRSKDQWEPVELEDWDQWAEFHVGLLHLLSSGTIRLISRLPQDKLKLVTNAQRTSDLVAYLAPVFALSETPTINFESRLRIQLGLLRVGRTFDVDQKRLPKLG
jgi:hypothetical protein